MKAVQLGNWVAAAGGRRFLLTLGCGMVCTLLVWFAKITPEIFRDLIVATVAVYIGGSTYEKVKNNPPPQEPLS